MVRGCEAPMDVDRPRQRLFPPTPSAAMIAVQARPPAMPAAEAQASLISPRLSVDQRVESRERKRPRPEGVAISSAVDVLRTSVQMLWWLALATVLAWSAVSVGKDLWTRLERERLRIGADRRECWLQWRANACHRNADLPLLARKCHDWLVCFRPAGADGGILAGDHAEFPDSAVAWTSLPWTKVSAVVVGECLDAFLASLSVRSIVVVAAFLIVHLLMGNASKEAKSPPAPPITIYLQRRPKRVSEASSHDGPIVTEIASSTDEDERDGRSRRRRLLPASSK